MPGPYLEALERLQDHIEPFPYEEVERIGVVCSVPQSHCRFQVSCTFKYVAKAQPYGRTLLLAGTGITMNVAIYKDSAAKKHNRLYHCRNSRW